MNARTIARRFGAGGQPHAEASPAPAFTAWLKAREAYDRAPHGLRTRRLYRLIEATTECLAAEVAAEIPAIPFRSIKQRPAQ